MSTDFNPYQVPSSDFLETESDAEDYELATIVERVLARVVDALILGFTSTVFLFILGLGVLFRAFLRGEEPPDLSWLPDTSNVFSLNLFDPIIWISICTTHVLFLVLHGVLLHRYGQTIGKRLLRIAIVDADTYEKVPLPRLFLLRYLIWDVPALFFTLVNWIVRIVDLAFGLNQDRRTLHDKLANTIVIKAKHKVRRRRSTTN